MRDGSCCPSQSMVTSTSTSCANVYVKAEISAAAKILKQFNKEFEKPKFKVGLLGKQLLKVEEISALADLPSLDALRAQFIGLLQTPATRIAVVLGAPASQIARVIKAHAVRDRGDVQALDAFRDVDYHLIDAPKGAGAEPVDLDLVRARRSHVPLILAGGLTAETVAGAAAAARPFAVDTASGTEAEPGVKDPERLRAFFDALQGARL